MLRCVLQLKRVLRCEQFSLQKTQECSIKHYKTFLTLNLEWPRIKTFSLKYKILSNEKNARGNFSISRKMDLTEKTSIAQHVPDLEQELIVLGKWNNSKMAAV
jgi:hypothetical protein